MFIDYNAGIQKYTVLCDVKPIYDFTRRYNKNLNKNDHAACREKSLSLVAISYKL